MADHVKRFLAVSRALHGKAVSLLATAKVSDLGEARAGAALVLTIIEQSLATIVLVENRCASHAPTFLRSMYEALAAAKLLDKRPGYLDQIRFDDLADEVAIISDVRACSDAGLTHEELDALAEQLSAASKNLQRLKSKGIRQKQARDKFVEAEIPGGYATYRIFCGSAHNRLSTLLVRHVGEGEMLLLSQPPTAEIELILGMAGEIVYQALALLPSFTNLSAAVVSAQIDDIYEHLIELRRLGESAEYYLPARN